MTDATNENKEFLCNTMIIKALLQFVPFQERKKAQEWLLKLQDIDDASCDTKMRNEYAFYLLINVQNGTMSQPFNKAPPQGKLKPLCRVLHDYVYEDVMKQLKISHCRLSKLLNDNGDSPQDPELACEPSGFLSQQPSPRKGVTVHCAAFSRFDEPPRGK